MTYLWDCRALLLEKPELAWLGFSLSFILGWMINDRIEGLRQSRRKRRGDEKELHKQ